MYVALGLFLISAIGWFFAPKSERAKLAGVWGFVLGSIGLLGVFAVLATLFANNRFEYPYVFGHSDLKNTLPYRIAGVWSGQEGSFLLWAVCAAIFGLITVKGTGMYRRWYTVAYALFLASLAGVLAYESPFKIEAMNGQYVVPPDGVGLSPALQNYWVIIHPPTIFLGFGALTILFCYAFSALVTRQVIDWARLVRPWALVSLTLVGVGLSMGGLWAYETLGWGGFWKWDPVENTSFVPFVLTAILTHGLIVQINRGKWVITNLLMGGLPFLSFIYGTFLTRSGVLGETSVHSFAEMAQGALLLLVGIGVISIVPFLGFWIARAMQLRREFVVAGGPRPGFTREGVYRWGSLLLFGVALAAGFGMSVPMLTGVFGLRMKVVEEPQYHQVVTWFVFPLLLIMAAAPFVAWGGVGLSRLVSRLYGPACVAFGLTGFTLLLLMYSPWAKLGPFDDQVTLFFGAAKMNSLTWTLILAGLCYFLVTVTLWTIFERWKSAKDALSVYLMHVGVGVLLAGLVLSRGLERTEQLRLQEGIPTFGMGYQLSVLGMTRDLADRDNKVRIEMKPVEMQPPGNRNGFAKVLDSVFAKLDSRKKYEARPGLYYMLDGGGNLNPMVWPDINHGFLNDMYLTLHPIAFEASDATQFKVGQTRRFDNYLITYEKMTRVGEPGQEGTKFGALLRIHDEQGNFRQVNPTMEITSAGPKSTSVVVDDTYSVSMEGMNAGDQSVTLKFNFNRPVYPVELFYKPFTSLVWGGLGILAAGGFLAAWNRRYRPKHVGASTLSEEQAAEEPKPDALAPTA